MVDSTGTTSWVFDAANRMTSCTTPGSNVVAYSYDNANRRTGVTLNTTTTWSYSFDNGNRLTSTTNPYSETTTTAYDAANRVTQTTAGNTSITAYGYDTLNRATDVWHMTNATPAVTLGLYQYAYDTGGNVTQRTDNDGSVTTFGYDAADQLTSEARTNSTNNYSISYAYDHNANRTSKTIGDVTDTYAYDSHDHLTGVTHTGYSKAFTSDNNGNVTSVTVGSNTTTLAYDYENRVTTITYPDTSTNSFQYNGLGLRTRKVDSAGTNNYVCDGTDAASPVLADSNATYTPGMSERRGGVSKFLHSDALGTTRGITNSTQTATDGLLFDAFGMSVSRTGTTPTPFGFVGAAQYQTDSDSGLQLLGHRYYDPSIGRFISQDPIQDGDNWYAYCGNGPLGGTDPEGLEIKIIGNNQFKAKIQGIINVIVHTERGKDLIYPFDGPHDPDIYIINNPGGGNSFSWTNPYNGHKEVHIDLNYKPGLWVRPPGGHRRKEKPQLVIVLAHELGHAIGDKDDGSGNMNNTNNNENPVRRELGYPARVVY